MLPTQTSPDVIDLTFFDAKQRCHFAADPRCLTKGYNLRFSEFDATSPLPSCVRPAQTSPAMVLNRRDVLQIAPIIVVFVTVAVVDLQVARMLASWQDA